MYKIITFLVLINIIFFIQSVAPKRHIKYPQNFSRSLESKEIKKFTELLLNDGGSDCTAPLHNLRSILSSGDIEKIILALELGIDINAPVDSDGNTMLMYAIMYGYKNKLETVRLLIDNNADMLKKNNRGFSALTCVHIDTDILKLMIDKGINLNHPEGYEVFIDSVSYFKKLRLFIENGVAINCVNKTGMTALMKALFYKGKPEIINYLIKNGADVNAGHPAGGLTPLMIAAWHNDTQNLKILIENGAAVNLKTAEGINALELAIEFNNTASIEILQNNGAVSSIEAEIVDNIKSGGDKAISNLEDSNRDLKNAGQDKITGHEKNIADTIMKAGSSGTNRLHKAIVEQDYETVKKLSTIYNAEPSMFDCNMMTPLFYAVIFNDVKAVRRLIKVSYIKYVDGFGMTVTRWARKLGRSKIIGLIKKREISDTINFRVVMQSGLCDTNNFLDKDYLKKAIPMIKEGNFDKIKKEFGHYFFGFNDSKYILTQTLFAASYNGDTESAEFLISKGVDINSARTGHEPISVLLAACYNDQREMAEYLIGKGADMNYETGYGYSIFHKIISYKRFELAELFIRKGFQLNNVYRSGRTPLMLACEGIGPDGDYSPQYLKMVKLLLKHGADPNIKSGGPLEQETALMMALEMNNIETARLLIENGADVNAADAAGITPLMIAARRGNTEGVMMLLKRGAGVNARDEDGENALFGAVRYGHNIIVKLLIDNKIELDVTNGRSQTLLQIARKFKNSEAAGLIELNLSKK